MHEIILAKFFASNVLKTIFVLNSIWTNERLQVVCGWLYLLYLLDNKIEVSSEIALLIGMRGGKGFTRLLFFYDETTFLKI